MERSSEKENGCRHVYRNQSDIKLRCIDLKIVLL